MEGGTCHIGIETGGAGGGGTGEDCEEERDVEYGCCTRVCDAYEPICVCAMRREEDGFLKGNMGALGSMLNDKDMEETEQVYGSYRIPNSMLSGGLKIAADPCNNAVLRLLGRIDHVMEAQPDPPHTQQLRMKTQDHGITWPYLSLSLGSACGNYHIWMGRHELPGNSGPNDWIASLRRQVRTILFS